MPSGLTRRVQDQAPLFSKTTLLQQKERLGPSRPCDRISRVSFRGNPPESPICRAEVAALLPAPVVISTDIIGRYMLGVAARGRHCS
jgi:hypothetical protein